MTYKLPPNGQWTQLNVGDSNGSLWSTFNVDLTVKKGDVKVTRLITSESTSSNLANLGTPIGFVKLDTGYGFKYFTVAGSRVFSQLSTYTSSAFVQDATSGTPTTCSSTLSDIINYNGYLYVSTSTNAVYKNTGSTWSNFTAGGADASPHMFCSYGGRLYMTRGRSQIISWDAADTVATSGTYTLNIPNSTENTITFIRSASDKIWVGTVNSLGGQGYIYAWDGVSGNPIKYTLNSTGVVAGVVQDDVPYVMDNNGRLLQFNGGTFKEIARLPNYRKLIYTQALSNSNDRWMHPNGMAIIENNISLLINTKEITSNTITTEEACPSGIWEFTKETGLYHKYSFSYLDSFEQAITDCGQNRIAVAGGLAYAKPSSESSLSNGTLLAGCSYYTNNSSTKFGIFFDDNVDNFIKAGYLVTTKIPSSQISDTWQKTVLKYNNLINSANKIVVKFRLKDVEPTEINVTWRNTTTFFTTTDLSSYWTSGTGFEVEVVQGVGSGMCSHITGIQDVDGGYLVTLDEVHTGVVLNDISVVRLQKWIKLGSVNDVTSTFKIMPFPTTASSNYIQLKIWMLMYGSDELKEVDVASVVSQPL